MYRFLLMDGQQQKTLILIGVFALIIGGLVYLSDRPSESIYLLPDWLASYSWHINLFGSTGDFLPTFFHVFAFILMTTACLTLSKGQLILVCAFWFVIDSLFEIAQSDTIAHWIAMSIGNRFDGFPVLENLAPYFLNGVFDIADIASIAVGAIVAFLTVHYVTNRNKGKVI